MPLDFQVTEGWPLRITWRSFGGGWITNLLPVAVVLWILFQLGPFPERLLPVTAVFVLGIAIWSYSAAVRAVNRTTLELSDSTLTIRVGPLPWFGGVTVPTAYLNQLFVRESGWQVPWRRARDKRYVLCARTADYATLPLVTPMEWLNNALWLERELEHQLGIKDESVAGEYAPDDAAGAAPQSGV